MRMTQLDGVRAIAVGLVMVEHFAGAAVNALIPIGAGTLGVGCFFTLSGFLITGILLRDFDAAGRGSRGRVWRDFYARRLLRLVPAYYAVLLALVLLGIQPIAESWPWHAAYLTNVWIALGNPSNVFWSLAVEEQFYLIWPIVLILTPRRHLAGVLFAMIALTLLFKAGVLVFGFSTATAPRLLPGSFTLLAAGCLLALVSYRGGEPNRFAWYRGRNRRVFDLAAWSALGLAIVIWAAFGERSLIRYFVNDLLCGVFYAWVVLRAAIGWSGAAGRFFANPALRFVGRISYGLYLVHNWMPDIVEKIFGALPKYQAAPLVLAMTFGICTLSWFLLERPILSLKRFFEERERPPTQRESSSGLAPARN